MLEWLITFTKKFLGWVSWLSGWLSWPSGFPFGTKCLCYEFVENICLKYESMQNTKLANRLLKYVCMK